MYIEKLNNDDFFLEKMCFNFTDYKYFKIRNEDYFTLDNYRDLLINLKLSDREYQSIVSYYNFYDVIYKLGKCFSIKLDVNDSKNESSAIYLFFTKLIKRLTCNKKEFDIIERILRNKVGTFREDWLFCKNSNPEYITICDSGTEYLFYINVEQRTEYIKINNVFKMLIDIIDNYIYTMDYLEDEDFIKYSILTFIYLDKVLLQKEKNNPILPMKHSVTLSNLIFNLLSINKAYNDYWEEQRRDYIKDENFKVDLLYKSDYTSRILLFNVYKGKDLNNLNSIFLCTKNEDNPFSENIVLYNDFDKIYRKYLRKELKYNITFTISENDEIDYKIEDYIVEEIKKDYPNIDITEKYSFLSFDQDDIKFKINDDFIISNFNYPFIFIKKDIDENIIFTNDILLIRHHPESINLLKTANIIYQLLNKKIGLILSYENSNILRERLPENIFSLSIFTTVLFLNYIPVFTLNTKCIYIVDLLIFINKITLTRRVFIDLIFYYYSPTPIKE